MSRCVDTNLDDPSDDGDSYSEYMSVVLNPLSLALGADGGRSYIRGAWVTSVGYLVLLSAFSFTSNFVLWRLRTPGEDSAQTKSPLTGYPGALVGAVSFCMDGAVSSGTMLAVFGHGVVDHTLGVMALAFCVVYIGHVLFVTVARFPANLVVVSASEKEVGDSADINGSPACWLRLSHWLEASSHEWSHPPEDKSATEWVNKYQSYIDDLKLRWYTALELAVALLTCVLSALAFGKLTWCISRGIICFLLLGWQCLVLVVLRPTVHKWRWVILSTVLALQTASAALSTANAPLQEQHIELTMDCLGAAVFFLLAIIFIADSYVFLVSSRANIRHVCLLIWSYIESFANLAKKEDLVACKNKDEITTGTNKNNENETLMVIPSVVEKDRVFDLALEADIAAADPPILLLKMSEEDVVKAEILKDLEAFEKNLQNKFEDETFSLC